MPALADLDPPPQGASAPSLPPGRQPGRQPRRWGDLGKRSASAVVLAPVALLSVWYGGWGWLALIMVGAFGLSHEWFVLCGRPRGWATQALLALTTAAAVIYAMLDQALLVLMLLVVGAAMCWILSRSPVLFAGVFYLALPLACLAWLRDPNGVRGAEQFGRADVIFVIAVVWASDIGAYLAGRLLGGPKLAPTISPGKTRSGAIGGLLAAVVAGEVVAHALAPGALGRVAGVACLLGVASQAGDLLESWIKRQFGVKDSGWLIPGHGGLLDRLDGLLAAAPAAACIAVTAGRGGVLWN